MKNFTNNFKQFTSRLSARWLIMALMLLLGSSSAWAAITIYFDNTNTKWSNVYIYLYSSTYWDSNNGSGANNIKWCNNGQPMTHIGNNIYSFSYDGTHSGIVAFTEGAQCGYNNFWETKACYSGTEGLSSGSTTNYSTSKPCFKPVTSGSFTKNQGKTTYYKGTWVAYASTYTISYNSNGGTGTITSQTKTEGTPITLSDGSGFSKTGYTLDSWNTNSEGTGDEYALSASYTTDAALALYAKWTANQYTINYKDQGDAAFSGTHANGFPTKHTYGSETALKNPTKAGYNFLGWFTNFACTGDAVTSLGATDYTSDITLYASWELACDPPAAPEFGSESSAEYCYGDVVSFPTINGVTLKWYDEETGGNVVESPETNVGSTNYYAASVEECESIERTQYTITIKTKPTVTLNPNENTVCADVTLGDITDYVEIESTNGSQISWYAAAQGGDALATSTPLMETSYFAEATLNGCSSDRAEFTITDVLSDPTEVPNVTAPETICDGESAVLELNNKDANYTYSVNGEEVDFTNNEYTVYPTITTDYTVSVENKCGSLSTTKTITVNPLPIISISGNNSSAVLYEDVTLTATGSDIDEVNWTITSGPGTLSNTTGTSVKLTSSTAGTVKVKATATSVNSCTKESNELSVTFANETCNNVADMTKIYLDVSENTGFITGNNAYVSVTASGNNSANCDNTSGANQNSYVPKNDTWWGTMTKVAGENYIYEITIPNNVTINKGTTKLSFWNNRISGNSDVWEVQAILGQTISAGTNCMKLSNKTKTHNDDRHSHLYCGTWTTYKNAPAITAPAAKTISVSTTDGEGNIIFSGQVVKTGCDNTNEYGFQYSSDEQTWTTVKVGENAAAGTAISNNTVNGLDGTYYVRAYITNDNSTQYGAIKEITVSTEKDPITSVTLTHVKDANGTEYEPAELANLTYCVGDEVWFELNYVGSKFIPENNVGYKWTTCPGNGLIGPYNGNKYKFTITSSGTIGISLRNEENVDLEGNPTWVESNLLEFKTHPEPTAPTISFATATICSNDDVGATLTLSATVSDQAYELWKYANDDDTEGSKVANVATLNCTENNQALQFTGIKTAGKYFVKTYYTAFCNTVIANSTHATLTVVNANDVYISISPATAETTPWMPVKLTVAASDDYTLEVPEGVEFNQNGNICSVKIPLPQGSTGGEGQYDNVSFPQDATTSYIVTAKLVSTGGEDNPCAVPATATVTLTPYVEECTIGH